MLSVYQYLCVFVSSSLPIPLLPNQREQLSYKLNRRQMANENGTFPAVDAVKELHPDENKEFKVDPVSSQVAEVNERKAEAEKKWSRKKDAVDTLKSRIIICGIVVVVIGAVFAMTRKLKEK